MHRASTLKASVTPAFRLAIDGCRLKCDQESLCGAFGWHAGLRNCTTMRRYIDVPGMRTAYLVCEKVDVRHFGPGDASLYQPYEFVEQAGAEKDVGANISIYA